MERPKAVESQPNKPLTIDLTPAMLAELAIRDLFAHDQVQKGRWQTRLHGKILIPRHMLSDERIQDAVNFLESSGRVVAKVQKTKGGFPDSGNLILGPSGDTLADQLNGVDPDTLKAPVRFYRNHPDKIRSIRLFENASSSAAKLNGVEVSMAGNHWWQKIAQENLRFGRGIVMVETGMDPVEFCDRSDQILTDALKLGRSIPGIKYIHFYLHSSGRLVFGIATGPNAREVKGINEILLNTNNLGQLREFVASLTGATEAKRVETVQKVASALHLGSLNDLLVNRPYIILSPEQQMVVSGGTYGPGVRPYMMGTKGAILFQGDADKVIPLGVRMKGKVQPALPRGIDPYMAGFTYWNEEGEGESPLVQSAGELELLAIGYHDSWPPVKSK